CAGGVFVAAGQTCAAASRLLVSSRVYDEFTTRLGDVAGRIRVGDPLNSSTQMGAQTSERQLDKIEGLVDRARQADAEVVVGGARLGADLSDGYFFSPTVVA